MLAGCAGISNDVAADEQATDVPTSTPSGVDADGTLLVHNINVGQSVAMLVIGPTSEMMLIDTGHFNDDGEHVLSYLQLSYLQQHDIDRIDYLVASQPSF